MATPYTDQARTPNAAVTLAIGAALFALLFLFLSITWADPDLWGHVKFGGDIAASGLHASDPYSFGSDRPWINHEWLAELLMYLSWASGGGAGLIALKTSLAICVLALAHASMARVPISLPIRILLLFTAAAGIWARIYVVRPQIFSIVLFAALLLVFRRVEHGGRRALWILPAIFACWVNLHGGWVVGLGAVAVWTALNLTPLRSAIVAPGHALVVVALCALATLLNPYGIGMWRFLAETVRLDRANIADWQPLFSTGAGKIAAWGTAATLAVLGLSQGGRGTPAAHALLVVGLGLASLKVSRLDAFFCLAVVMLLSPQIAAFAEGNRRRPAAPLPRWRLLAAAAVAGVFAALLVKPQTARCIRLDGPWMPEREAASWLEARKLDGRLLVWFDWGQYAIWHFAPELRVSFDGRRETVYTAEYVRRHTDLYFSPDSERAFLDALDADYAWLERELPLVAALERAGWTRAFEGRVSVVLARHPVPQAAPPTPAGPACFPGP